MPVILLCILIVIIKQKKVVIGDGSVLPNVLLRHECGSNGNDVTISDSNLYGSEVPYCWDSDVLGRVIGSEGRINFYIKCREEDHDGLGCDDGHGSRVSSFTSVIALADGFLRIEYYLLPR